MLNLMRNIRLMLLVATFSFFLGSCTGGGSDAGGGRTIPVTVNDYSMHGVPNVTVVLGDSNGAMKDYGTTDANGQITFANAPANATITAAMSCLNSGETTTTYSIESEYDVNGSVALYVDACIGFPLAPFFDRTPIGTVTVNLNNPLSGIAHYAINTGYWPAYFGYGTLTTQQTITITQGDLQSDGKLSLFVIGEDANYKMIGYGILLDQAFTNGMIVDIDVNKPMSFVQYQISNIPLTAKYLSSVLVLSRMDKGAVGLGNGYSLSSVPSSTTINVPYIPDFGDQFSYSLYADLDQNSNGSADSTQALHFSLLSAAVPTDQTFDLSHALSAPSALTVSGANTVTPTLTWSGVDPGATSAYVSADIQLQSSSTSHFYGGISASNNRTSIVFPELPDSLAAFRPVDVDSFEVYTDADADGVSRSSSGQYSSTLNFAPGLGKSKAAASPSVAEKRMRFKQKRALLQSRLSR